MKTNRYVAIIAMGALVSLSACDGGSDSEYNTRPTINRSEPDNTARNEGDGSAENKTPIDQSESSDNIQITAQIRRAIMNDDSMSVNAQNCKIITDQSGVVTLRGVVNSDAEKVSIDSKAKAIAGVTRVDNQLEVKTD